MSSHSFLYWLLQKHGDSVKIKNKLIICRLDENLYEFLKDVSIRQGITTSELVRRILLYFYMGIMTNEFTASLTELKKKYAKIFKFKPYVIHKVIKEKNNPS